MDSTAPAPAPTDLANALVDLLTIEELDTDLYRGRRPPGGVGRVFGGQVIAQGLQAAQRTNEAPKTAHSHHASFMRTGNERSEDQTSEHQAPMRLSYAVFP